MGRLKPLRRVGLELELLAPVGESRVTFGRALARRVKGRVQFGFKYFSEGTLPDGRPMCRLSLAARVLDRHGEPSFTLVDDNTLRGGLPTTPRGRTLYATDDLRLALLAERLSFADSLAARPEALRELFGGFVTKGTLFDAFGHPVLVSMAEPMAWQRVCEVVTRPLISQRDRRQLLSAVLDTANELGCAVPGTAALHAHYDAQPFRDVRRLSRLVLHHATQRARWWATLSPNPRCLKLGAFPDDVVKVASSKARVAFPTFAAALRLAKASKDCDLNLLGVIEPYPRQPTLEVRCLPMALEVGAVLGSLELAEQLLLEAW